MSGIIGTSSSRSKVVGSSKDTCKAWASIYFPSGVPTANKSFGISSSADQGNGFIRLYFSTPMANVNYVAAGMGAGGTSAGAFLVLSEDLGGNGSYGRSTAYAHIKFKGAFNSVTEGHNATIVFFGD